MESGASLQEKDSSYYDSEVNIRSGGREVVVISDLHMAAGINSNGNYAGTENFFADDSLKRFLQYLQAQKGKQFILVINGDFLDFLRVTELPVTEADFALWQTAIARVGISKTLPELRASIDDKERKYGLKTNDYKSVWKLHVCIKGHAAVFEQLAAWLGAGHQLIISKGNHDLEWYWEAVRNYLAIYFTEMAALKSDAQAAPVLKQAVQHNLLFVDNALIIDEKMYIAHGHEYENMTFAEGTPTINDNTELRLAFGSFFNRYLINRLELAYPFLDNVRPTQAILPLMLRERFPLGVQVILKYIPFAFLIIPKEQYKQALKYLLNFLVIIVLPILITAFAIWQTVKFPPINSGNSSFIAKQIIGVLKNFGLLFLSYIFVLCHQAIDGGHVIFKIIG